MVRGNWQKRVESAAVRKEATRRRKQLRGDRDAHKQQFQRFLSFLDDDWRCCNNSDLPSSSLLRVDDNGNNDDDENKKSKRHRDVVVHIWTSDDGGDTTTTMTPSSYDDGSGGNGGKTKYRSGSFSDYASDNSKTPRKQSRSRRSGSFDSPGGKKIHPRSHQKHQQQQVEGDGGGVGHNEDITAAVTAYYPPLCKNFFFYDNCQRSEKGKGGKKLRCHHAHFDRERSHADGSNYCTLADVMKKSPNEQKITSSFDAAVLTSSSSTTPDDDTAMDMVHHLSFTYRLYRHSNENDLNDDAIAIPSLSETMSKTLVQKKRHISNVMYVTVDDELVYDRHRGGCVVVNVSRDVSTNLNQMAEETFEEKEGRKDEATEQQRRLKDDDGDIVTNVPPLILECILTFLPDESTAILPRVCRTWHDDISQSSPFLWDHLLTRNDWPHPPTGPTDYRSAYVSHRTVHRTVKGLVDGFRYIISRGGGGVSHHEKQKATFVITEFCRRTKGSSSSSSSSSIQTSHCRSLHYWNDLNHYNKGNGDNNHSSSFQFLAGFDNDATLRLFKTSPPSLSCRQILAVRCTPPPRRKLQWTLRDMSLDDSYVACLVSVTSPDNDHHDNNDNTDPDDMALTFISRDHLLGAGGREVGSRPATLSEDDNELTICYLDNLVKEYFNERGGVIATAADWGEESLYGGHEPFGHEYDEDICYDVRVSSRSRLVSCGNNNFMMEVVIAFRHYLQHRWHCLCLVSAFLGQILWMQIVPPFEGEHASMGDEPVPRFIAAGKGGCNDENKIVKGATTVAIGSYAYSCCEFYYVTVVKGKVLSPLNPFRMMIFSGLKPEEEGAISTAGASPPSVYFRSMVIVRSTIIIAHVYKLFVSTAADNNDYDNIFFTSILSFHSLDNNDDETTTSTTEDRFRLGTNCCILSLESVGDNYIFLIIRANTVANNNNDNGNEEDDIDGTWFTPPTTQSSLSLAYYAIIIDIITRREIERVFLADCDNSSNNNAHIGTSEVSNENLANLRLAAVNTTCMAWGVSNQGIIVAGSSVVDVAGHDGVGGGLNNNSSSGDGGKESSGGSGSATTTTTTPKSSKKKKRQKGNKGKKDGFARGMSLRG